MAEHQSFRGSWQERLSALRNTPPVLKIVWQSGPGVVIFGLVARLFASLLPLVLLWIPKLIVDAIVHARTVNEPVSPRLWWLVAAEFGFAVLGGIIGRAIDYSDSLLADKYTRHVSIQVMKHAAELDLIAYEDPVFYDRLERARVQATDRLGMIQQIGRLIQLVITTATLSVTIIVYSPWLMLLLIAGVLPAFLGESHFAFLGYAKNFRQTPVRRQLDYLRQVGGSKEAAKELKLFGLSKFLTERFTLLSDGIYEENVALSRRKLIAGAFPLGGRLRWVLLSLCVCDLADCDRAFTPSVCGTCCPGAILQASNNLQQIFSTLSGIADQALFLTDLLAFFDMQPTIQSKPNALPAPRPIVAGIRISQCLISLSGKLAAGAQWPELPFASGRTGCPDWGEWRGQDHDREADHAALRSR